MPNRKETDLYLPVKLFLEKNQYQVKGEVVGCDLVAVRDDQIIIVELKTHFNLELVLQGVKRQTFSEHVYLAVEAPQRCKTSRWQDILRLCRRLGLGLMTVSFLTKQSPRVEVCCEAEPVGSGSNYRKRKSIKQEFAARTGDFNEGGSCRRPVVTAYREQALLILAELSSSGPSSPKQLQTLLNLPKTASILQNNVYGWFVRIQRGLYGITPQGEKALNIYADIVHHWKEDDE